MILSLVIGGLLLGIVIGIAAYGWLTLPSDARVPMHYGLGFYNNFAPKTVGLLLWPAAGLLILRILTAVAEHAITRHHQGASVAPLIIMPIVLAIVAAAEWGAITVARRNTTVPPR